MKRKGSFIIQNVGSEKILVPIGSQIMDMNGIVILNSTALCLWELLADERSAEELAVAMAERFDVTTMVARSDVNTFIDEIAKMGILEK